MKVMDPNERVRWYQEKEKGLPKWGGRRMNEIIVTAKEFDEEEKILTLDRRVVDRGLLGSYDKIRCRTS